MRKKGIPLRLLAHGRAGDKGNCLNVSVIAHEAVHFDHLVECVTEEVCALAFQSLSPAKVTRFVLPNIAAMNFVLDDVLDGGVNQSLQLDRHGKSFSYLLLDTLIPAPEGWGL